MSGRKRKASAKGEESKAKKAKTDGKESKEDSNG